MKNMEAWKYVHNMARLIGAPDPEGAAQEVLTKAWDYDAPRGFWAVAARNKAYEQWRWERRHVRLAEQQLREYPPTNVYYEDFDSGLMLEWLRENHPNVIRDLVNYETGKSRKQGDQPEYIYTRARRAREVLRAVWPVDPPMALRKENNV